jgi:hypothetical protein
MYTFPGTPQRHPLLFCAGMETVAVGAEEVLAAVVALEGAVSTATLSTKEARVLAQRLQDVAKAVSDIAWPPQSNFGEDGRRLGPRCYFDRGCGAHPDNEPTPCWVCGLYKDCWKISVD